MECQWNAGRSLWIKLGVHIRCKSPPVDGARRASIVMFTEIRLGIRCYSKSTPVESNGTSEMSLVDRQLRNVWAYGNMEQPASVEWKRDVVGPDALGIRGGKLPRSTICEMQARNRS